MKKILSAFILITFIALGWRSSLNIFLYKSSALKIPAENEIVFMGASHGSYGINPAYTTNTSNINVVGEIIYFTEKKMDFVLKNNPHIKEIYVTISPDTFAEAKKELLVTPRHLISYTANHHFLLNLGDIKTFLQESNNTKEALQNIFNVFVKRKGGFIKPSINEMEIISKMLKKNKTLKNDYNAFKGYVPLEGNKNQTEKWLSATIENRFYTKDESVTSLSPLLAQSLFKMGEIAKENKIKLNLLITPKHEYFLEGIPESFQREYDELIEEFSNLFPEVVYLDLSTLTEFTKDLFHDYDHLNSDGAKVLSEYLEDNFFNQIF